MPQELRIKTGYIHTSFAKSPWLDLFFSKLYYVKNPCSGHYKRNKYGNFEYDLYWATQDDKLVGIDSFDDAAIMDDMNPEDANRLDFLRSDLFDIRIQILNVLLKSIYSGASANFWNDCLQILTNKLTYDDIIFLSNMDKLYDDYGAGTLNNLLTAIGHFEKELTIGTLAHTREALGDLVQLDSLKRHRLVFWNYLQAIGTEQRKTLDTSLDLFISLFSDKEDPFWSEFDRRVDYALHNEFTVNISFNETIEKKYQSKFELNIKKYIEFIKSQLKTTGDFPKLSLSQQSENQTQKQKEQSPFRHFEDFRSVLLRGKIFYLTSMQAEVVQILYKAYQNGTPDVGQDYILEEIGSKSSKLRYIFKNSESWGELVVKGSKKGTYRLDI